MKFKFTHLFLLLTVLIPLSGCHLFGLDRFIPYTDVIEDDDTFERIEGEGYYKPASYLPISYYDCYTREESTLNNYYEMFSTRTKNYWRSGLDSVGTQRLLVIPVSFRDYYITATGRTENETKTTLENVFFGAKEATSFESVASFYNRTSYGKFKLEGKVSNWFQYPRTAEDLENLSSAATYEIALDAVEWYFKSHPEDRTYFDQNGDGRVDALYLIYSCPPAENGASSNSIFWAYTVYNNTSSLIGNYSWTSYYQLNDNIGYADARVLIHETGHLFGLPDLYNTNGGTITPSGRLDMMDYSIGDHSSLIKMLLSWTRPYVVTGPTRLTLRPFTTSGDVILIPHPNGWNGSMFDEYLLVEYYAPVGFNYPSSYISFYTGDGRYESASMPPKPGVKIYHVDATLGYFHVTSAGSTSFLHEVDKAYRPSDASFWLDLAYSNNSNTHPLYLLLEKSESNRFLTTGGTMDMTSLYLEGDNFGEETYSDFTFYDDTPLNISMDVVDMNNYEVTLDFDFKIINE